MSDPSPPSGGSPAERITELVKRLERFINWAVSGSLEHGAFGRGETGEYVPHPKFALRELEQEITTLRAQVAKAELGRVAYMDSKFWERRAEAAEQQLAQITQDRDEARRVASEHFEQRCRADLRADRSDEYVKRAGDALAAARQENETLRAELETVRTQWRERSRGPI
jgi:hypothetical protein